MMFLKNIKITNVNLIIKAIKKFLAIKNNTKTY